jgi:hypothetical protein
LQPSGAVSFVGDVKGCWIREQNTEREIHCSCLGERRWKSGQDGNPGRRSRSKSGQHSRRSNLDHCVNAIASTPFANIERPIENGNATEIVVLPRIICWVAVLSYGISVLVSLCCTDRPLQLANNRRPLGTFEGSAKLLRPVKYALGELREGDGTLGLLKRAKPVLGCRVASRQCTLPSSKSKTSYANGVRTGDLKPKGKHISPRLYDDGGEWHGV